MNKKWIKEIWQACEDWKNRHAECFPFIRNTNEAGKKRFNELWYAESHKIEMQWCDRRISSEWLDYLASEAGYRAVNRFSSELLAEADKKRAVQANEKDLRAEFHTQMSYLFKEKIDLEARKDELESELARVKERLEENAKELEKEREKNAPPWWETYVPQERTKDALRKELIKKYKELRDEDDSLVYASMGKRKIGIEDRRAEIMEAVWLRIPEYLRKGVFMSKTGEFSFEALVKAVKRDNPSAMAQTPQSPGPEKFGGQEASRARSIEHKMQ